jgi:ribokinase
MDRKASTMDFDNRLNVVVIGDIALDWIVNVADVDARIANLQLESSNAIVERLGGGGLLFATAAAVAGFTTSLISRVGTDLSGNAALDWLSSKGVSTAVTRDERLSTGKSLILRDEGRDVKVMLSHRGANVGLAPKDIPHEVIQHSDLLYISGYAFLEAPQSTAALMAIEIAKSHSVSVILDVVPHRIVSVGLPPDYQAALALADFLVLELGTARRLLNRPEAREEEALTGLLERYSGVVLYPSNEAQIIATRDFTLRSETGYASASNKTGYLDKHRAEAIAELVQKNRTRPLKHR